MAPDEGPSPLARGRQDLAKVIDQREGTIPARAGETAAQWCDAQLPGDHPRSRGGDLSSPVFSDFTTGPSPLARGRPAAVRLRAASFGTIPARAGETRTHSRRAALPRDHPRSRGGDVYRPEAFVKGEGPSPLARGRPDHRRISQRGNGTIPARAGETPGPSPLARGRLPKVDSAESSKGTIPARAGETELVPDAAPSSRDHPRSRGGDHSVWSSFLRFSGPSPLARGRLGLAGQPPLVVGTIPARAGETTPSSSARITSWTIPARAGETRRSTHCGTSSRDHPRSRGGDDQITAYLRAGGGPSPLARGRPMPAR